MFILFIWLFFLCSIEDKDPAISYIQTSLILSWYKAKAIKIVYKPLLTSTSYISSALCSFDASLFI